MTSKFIKKSKLNNLIKLSMVATLGSSYSIAVTATEQGINSQDVEQISVIGTRRAARVDTDTPVPVDIIPMDKIAGKSGQLDIGQLLNFAAPSFNSNRQAGSDGSDHIDAASLRGLGPDQVLVLINGKRRHTSSLINVFGSRARGTVGTDLNTIPVIAIKRIEILRDGAAAQYGSDAIAGVINIVLKDKTGLDFVMSTGQYTEGDGQSNQIAANYGVEFGDDGSFINLSGEYTSRDKTNRAPEGDRRTIGDSDVENASLMLNTEVVLNDDTVLYGFAGLNSREGVAGAWFRSADDDRNVAEIYPTGFVPSIASDIMDKSLTVGLRSKMGEWDVDISNTYGTNKMMYFISNTLNASLGVNSPTSFDAGGFSFTQNTTNIDITQYFDNFESIEGINIAGGFEYRNENYQIFSGEEGSYKNYGLIEYYDKDLGEMVKVDLLSKAGGSQGFPGFQPSNELDRSRSNISAYVDFEGQITDDFLATTAFRGEHYSDFGTTFNGKVSFAYSGVEDIVFRGSASTGFRAPSLQQRYYNQVITNFVKGEAVDVVYEANDGKLTKALGIPDLKEEKSVNMSLGMTATFDAVTVSVDAYQIKIEDKVVLTGQFGPDGGEVGDILNDLNVGLAQFFTNAIDTKTIGLDLTVSHEMDLGEGSLKTFLSANYNKTEIDGGVQTAGLLQGKEDIYFDARERYFLEGGAPKTKFALSFDYELEKFSANLRTTYFGEVELGTWSSAGLAFDTTLTGDLVQTYDAKFSTDI
ncbi:MAG: TonB-dependent receptor, partial [Gammaproteobacteria bacterium]|nr:TonB-dependent receptor [Gammaproteobacteria bacterium]